MSTTVGTSWREAVKAFDPTRPFPDGALITAHVTSNDGTGGWIYVNKDGTFSVQGLNCQQGIHVASEEDVDRIITEHAIPMTGWH